MNWQEVLDTFLNISTFTIVAIGLYFMLTPANNDLEYCDYLKAQSTSGYNQAMTENEFVKATCCQFDNHKTHAGCQQSTKTAD